MDGRNHALDGLRGFAALNVAMAHFALAFHPILLKEQYPKLQVMPHQFSLLEEMFSSFPLVLAFNGHFAVMIFFVLSGYVIVLPYYDGKKGVLFRRLIARPLRLAAPFLVAVVASYLVWRFGGYYNGEAGLVFGSRWFTTFFKGGAVFRQVLIEGVFVGDNILIPPGWTIRIELMGSVVVLLFYIICPARFHYFLAFLVILFFWYLVRQDSVYCLSIIIGSFIPRLPRIDGRVTGLLVFIGGFLGAYSPLVSFYNGLPSLLFRGIEIWRPKDFYNLIGAFLIVISVVNGFGGKLFGSKLMLGLGKISYSLYLIHFIVLCSIVSNYYINSGKGFVVGVCMVFLYVAITMIFSTLFYFIVDKPAAEYFRRISLRVMASNSGLKMIGFFQAF